jgi:hypothetical protein
MPLCVDPDHSGRKTAGLETCCWVSGGLRGRYREDTQGAFEGV